MDSFRLIRIDTISQRDKYFITLKYIREECKYYFKETEVAVAIYKREASIANKYYRLSSPLYATYKAEADDQKKEVDTIEAKINQSVALQYSFLTMSKKADTIMQVGYEAICLYQLSRKDQTVKKDTAYIILNIDKNVVNRKEFFKYE